MTALNLYHKPRRRKRLTPEASLQKTVIQHLLLNSPRNTIYHSIPNERECTARQMKHLKDMGLLPGVADLIIIVPGQQAAYLELKARGETQSEDQIAFEELCDRNGSRYGLADNIDDALSILRAWGVLPALRSSSRRAA